MVAAGIGGKEKDMTREDIEKAALKGVEEYVNSGNLKGFRGSYCKGFMEGAEWYKNQSSWISVDERLPELNVRVLVAQRGINRISICIMKRIPHDSSNQDNKKWHWSLTNNKDEVIAWKPLPHFDETLLKKKGYE